MKHNRSLIEKISIKSNTPHQSKPNHSVISNLSKNNSALSNQSKINDEQHNSHLSFQKIVSDNIPINDQQQSKNQDLPQKQNSQESKIHELKNNLSSLSVSVSNIKQQYTDLKMSQSRILSTAKLKKKERKITKLDHPQIAQFLFKKQQEQQKRQKRRLDDIAKLQRIKTQQQESMQKQKQLQKQQKINQLKKQWFVKQKNQQKRNQQSLKQKNADQIYKKYRNSIPLFEIKQKLSKQQQLKKNQLIKQYLKKHKQNYLSIHQPFKQKQLEQHNKKHNQKKQSLEKQKNQQKINIFQKIQKDNQSFKNLYRGKISEQVIQQLKAQEEKKQIPYRIRQRIKNYQGFIKENYKPKIRQSKLKQSRSNSSSLQIKHKRQNDSHLSFRQIKRYKYLHGVSFGEIVEQRPMAKSYEEQKRTGNGYLEYMKSLPKKRVDNAQSIFIPMPKSPRPNPLMHNRQKKALVQITDQPTRAQINMILDQLRLNDKKLKQRQKVAYMKGPRHEMIDSDRRQLNNDLMLNVEKKMNLLHKLENNKVFLDGRNEDNQQ